MARPQVGALPGTPSTQAFGDAAAKGSGPSDALEDHKHAWPALGTTAAAIGTSAGGSATTPSKSDHVHATGAGTPSTQAFGDAAATGSGPAAAMTDHKHAMPALGTTPSTQAFGDAAAGGSATTAAKNDHKHAMPNSTAGPDADITADAAGAAGTANTAARAAHGHKVATDSAAQADTTPLAAGTAGTSGTIARGGHTHQSPGGIFAISANQSTGASTNEKRLVGGTLPANFMAATTMFRARAACQVTVAGSATACTMRFRIGTTTLTGNIPASLALTVGSVGFVWFEAIVVIRTNGASGTATGEIMLQDAAPTASVLTTKGLNVSSTMAGATVVVDTTAQKEVEFTCQMANAGNTLIAYVASMEVVVM